MLLEGDPEELRFAGERLEAVLILLLGLEADPPDKEDSVEIQQPCRSKKTSTKYQTILNRGYLPSKDRLWKNSDQQRF